MKKPPGKKPDQSPRHSDASLDQVLSVLNAMDDLIFVLDLEGRFTWYFQPASYPSLYVKPEQFLGRHFRDILPPEVADPLQQALDEIRTSGGIRRFEYPLTIQGEEAWFHARVAGMKDSEGTVSGIASTIRDITERVRREGKLRREHHELMSIFDSIDEPIYVADPDTYEVLYLNQAMRNLFGDVLGQKCYRSFQNQEAPCPFCTNDRIFGEHAGRPYIWEVQNQANQCWYRCIDRAIHWPDGRLVRYEMAIDITERRKAVDALAAEKEQLSVTLRSIGDGVISTDAEGRIVLMNRIAEQFTGWSQAEARGRPLHDVFRVIHEETREPQENLIQEVVSRQGVVELGSDIILIGRDGTKRVVSDSGAPIRTQEGQILGVVLVFRDVTEKRRMEKELLRAQNLESLGVLAGGIAHDFNNILTAIMGNVNLAKILSGPEHEAFPKLEEAERASGIAQGLAQQLLTFSRGGAPVKKPSSVARLLEEAANLAVRGSNVKCELNLPGDLLPVAVDRGQMHQVFNNLIINAVQSMPGGGVIKIRAENASMSYSKQIPLEAGKYVRIQVQDPGEGIAPEHLARVFDPYFTTKRKGTGLGLASAYSIVKKHGGHITADSIRDRGSTFTLYLPAREAGELKQETPEDTYVHGRGRILVMDDEEIVRSIVEHMLHHLGYETTVARDGPEAVELFSQAVNSDQPFQAVILDLTIQGGWGGVETIKVLRKIDPEVKAIVASGYSNDPVMADYWRYGFSGVIRKPFRIEELGKIVHAVLIQGGGGMS